MRNFALYLPALALTLGTITETLAAEPAAPSEQALIAVLKSDAPPGEKGLACKRLAIHGSKEAVPVLAPLLADPQLSSWARIAMQSITGPEADAALRSALDTVGGRQRIGVINTIGLRRDVQAVAPLTTRLADTDAEVASAAAVALGHIGGSDAEKALLAALAKSAEGLRSAAAEGVILCAEQRLGRNEATQAAALYDAVRTAQPSRQKTREALRGAILARHDQGLPMLRDLLRASDEDLFQLGLTVARELEASGVPQLLAEELAETTPQREPGVLLALADRGGPQVLAAALQRAKSSQAGTRLTAIHVLERLGHPDSIPVLLAATMDADTSVAKAAKATLAGFQGAGIDEAIIERIKQPAGAGRVAAMELAGLRNTRAALPFLLTAANDPAPDVRAASLKVITDLATLEELDDLLGLLTARPDEPGLERALSALCTRSARPDGSTVVVRRAVYGDLPGGPQADVTAKVRELVGRGIRTIEASNAQFGDPAGGRVKRLQVDYEISGQPQTRTAAENDAVSLAGDSAPSALIDSLAAAVRTAPLPAREVALRLLKTAGGPRALEAVRSAAAEEATKRAASRVLCDWPTPDALPDLARMATAASDETLRILAVRGQVRLIPLMPSAPAQRADALREVMTQAPRVEEKRLAVAALAEIPDARALGLLTELCRQEEVREEAGTAAVTLGAQLMKSDPRSVASAMGTVAALQGASFAERARELLRQAEAAQKR